jgi:putative transcriptional regulator
MKKRVDGDRSLGEDIIAGLEEALAYERGELADVKVTRATLASQSAAVAPAPNYQPDRIASLRKRLRLSQPVFAAALNVSPETVKKWEQGTREPDGAALRLLELAEAHPEWIIDRISLGPARQTSPKIKAKARAAVKRSAR